MILLLLLAAALPLSTSGQTDWCDAGQPTTGTYTLAAGSTCDCQTLTQVLSNEHLIITASFGPGLAKPIINMVVNSASETDPHFLVYGNLTLEGLVLQNGQASATMGYSGGSIVAKRPPGDLMSTVKPIIILNDVLFLNNEALNSGGAIAAQDTTLIIGSGCEFIGNRATKGGAIAAHFYSGITIGGTDPVKFKNNIAASLPQHVVPFQEFFQNSGDAELKAVFPGLENLPSGLLSDSDITSLDPSYYNLIVGEGGAIFLDHSDLITADESVIIFDGNKAGAWGGALSATRHNLYTIVLDEGGCSFAEPAKRGQTITQIDVTGSAKFTGTVISCGLTGGLIVQASDTDYKNILLPVFALDYDKAKFKIDGVGTDRYPKEITIKSTPSLWIENKLPLNFLEDSEHTMKHVNIKNQATVNFTNNRALALLSGDSIIYTVDDDGKTTMEFKPIVVGMGGAVDLYGRKNYNQATANEFRNGGTPGYCPSLFSISGLGTQVMFDGNQAVMGGAVSTGLIVVVLTLNLFILLMVFFFSIVLPTVHLFQGIHTGPGWTLQISGGANVVFQNQRVGGRTDPGIGVGGALAMYGPLTNLLNTAYIWQASLIVKDVGTTLLVKDNLAVAKGAGIYASTNVSAFGIVVVCDLFVLCSRLTKNVFNVPC
jgi:predicted outer membrane repeat protein